jgi:hypothetical protein
MEFERPNERKILRQVSSTCHTFQYFHQHEWDTQTQSLRFAMTLLQFFETNVSFTSEELFAQEVDLHISTVALISIPC